ncbi:MAG: FMN-binding protein [Betaproteobacteria bacterium]|nr:FMN-binding protein [Betaproteobacteria bacterium]
MDPLFRWLAPPVAVLASASAYAVQYMKAEDAQKLMFPDSTFVASHLTLNSDQRKAVEKLSGQAMRIPDHKVWKVEKGGKLVGYFFVDEVWGKHELITYAVGITAEGKVRQVEVLDYRETHGFEIRNPRWRQQFVGKSLDDNLVLNKAIKNITDATMSCRHVTDGVRRLLALHQLVLTAPTPQ